MADKPSFWKQKLTPNFALNEFLMSETADRKGFKLEPSVSDIENLQRLCSMILEPLRASLGAPIIITSGYRSKELNTYIGGASKSKHMEGRSADLVVPGYRPIEVCRRIVELELPFTEVINEFGRWCHVTVEPATGPKFRQAVLTAARISGAVVYSVGLKDV